MGTRVKKATFIFRHDELKKKKQHVGALKRSRRGSRKVVGDLCTEEMLCWLNIANSLMRASSFPLKLYFHISPHICHFGF